MAVVGVVHPDRVLTNAGARPGDALVLTKPVGIGVLTTARKHGALSDRELGEAIAVMTTLNDAAAAAAEEIGADVHAATDVTGFGLLGHLRELCLASGVGAVVDHASVPALPNAIPLLGAGMVAGGTRRNHTFVAPDVDFGGLAEPEQLLLADAQTSGGLLLAVAPAAATALVEALARRGVTDAQTIGHLRAPGPSIVTVT
jgi:selenide,water dikinase